MRHVFWMLILLATCGCSAFSAPAPKAKVRTQRAATMLDFESPAVACDYGNKLTL